MPLLVKGGRVVDPASGTDEALDLLIEGGRVARRGRGLAAPKGAEVLDARGLVVAPGFIDMHVHFREPGQEYKEDIESGTRAAASGGFTSVACMANTDPVNDTSSVTERILKRAREVGAARVHPIGAVSMGLKGEALTEMAEQLAAGAVAFSDDGVPVRTAALMRAALDYAGMLGAPILDHAEDRSLSQGKVMHEGKVSTLLGLSGNPAASEDICVFRDIRLAELMRARVHILHLSSRGAVELIRQARKRGVRVSGEATPHHFTLTHEAIQGFNAAAKMAPPLREEEDRQALLEGLRDGTIEVIASDHAPHYEAELQVEFDEVPFGVVGLETAVPLALDRLHHAGVLTLPQLISKFTAGPAKVLGLKLGTLAEGAPGDVTLLDPGREFVVDPEGFESRGRNTPFGGWKLRGCAVATVVNGEIRMNRIAGPMQIFAGERVA
ncbi:MAG: dihydroorotase [Candidatus Tectomicrobia bacterium RIFCSPLOWO2_12_FULL_69_37]|nr:MAG: dihydroorotase [Candidatus Tectomicrobia bacterium RIFCSPLOWO2_12_FULL_69_37]